MTFLNDNVSEAMTMYIKQISEILVSSRELIVDSLIREAKTRQNRNKPAQNSFFR